jgi:hypothetical protein
MKILFLLFSLLSFSCINAQAPKGNTWTVEHNKTIRLKASGENVAKNTIAIKADDLKAEGQVCIDYTEEKPLKDWKRTFAVLDEKDNDLMTYTGHSFKIGNAKLRSLAGQGIKTIRIYTWALPTDPDLASRIRIKRVHLATIKLE